MHLKLLQYVSYYLMAYPQLFTHKLILINMYKCIITVIYYIYKCININLLKNIVSMLCISLAMEVGSRRRNDRPTIFNSTVVFLSE